MEAEMAVAGKINGMRRSSENGSRRNNNKPNNSRGSNNQDNNNHVSNNQNSSNHISNNQDSNHISNNQDNNHISNNQDNNNHISNNQNNSNHISNHQNNNYISNNQDNNNHISNNQHNNYHVISNQYKNSQGNNDQDSSQTNNHRESSKKNDQESNSQGNDNQQIEKEKHRDERIEQTGQATLDENAKMENIHLISIIGEIEGHENLSNNSKTTKYEHILPSLAAIEDSKEIQGVLVLLNTMGGDVEAGLAIAEMLASLSKPTVSLVLGGSHSIGVPIAVSTDYSFIVPTGTMVIHPVRMSGMVIGVPQTFDYFKLIQDRITGFVCRHCNINKNTLEELMTETGILTKDVGTILVGEEAVKYGIIDEVGGIDKAIAKLHSMIQE